MDFFGVGGHSSVYQPQYLSIIYSTRNLGAHKVDKHIQVIFFNRIYGHR